jgi:hypothetical protein
MKEIALLFWFVGFAILACFVANTIATTFQTLPGAVCAFLVGASVLFTSILFVPFRGDCNDP